MDRSARIVPRRKGCLVNRRWSRIGVRAASVGLLLAGLVAGVYLGQDRPGEQTDAATAMSVAQVDVDDMQLLKQRQNDHVAARAWQRQAENAAAAKAAVEAKATAGRAHALETKMVAKKKAAAEAKAAGPVAYSGPIPASCDEFSGSRKIGCALTIETGFGIAEFPCLEKLWTKESGWNYKAANGSGAYGIPQALPGSKMASKGADWKTNPATQIKWGLGYIKGRYQTPCGAWSHFQSANSY
jgi:hypothetical protein